MVALARDGADLSALDGFETSGIAGTSIAMDFSWGMARWLARRHPRAVSLSEDGGDASDRLGATLPRFLPFLEERSLVDSGVDVRTWLEAALPRGTRDGGLRFLVDRLDALPWDDAAKGELWDSLGLLVRWALGAKGPSRTFLRLPAGRPFVDAGPLVVRRDVSIAGSCASAPSPRRVTRADGERFLDAARAAVGVRYRELYSFTWGNPADVFVADCGRGLAVWCCGLLPERRLPLRAGYGFLLVRNGVPVGYGDAYALGDRLDLSFNVFYAFREGESAYTYARTIAFFVALLGTRSVWVDPYQIGAHNEEAITSGAFWFYRKLGFRCAGKAEESLVRREEARAAAAPGHRTSARTLRRLARAPLTLDLPGASPHAWDGFSLDALGLAVQRRMAASGLSPDGFRARAARYVARTLGLSGRPRSPEARALSGLAPVLDLLLGRPRLDASAKAELLGAVRAKAGRSEVPFVRALARSPLLPTLVSAGRP